VQLNIKIWPPTPKPSSELLLPHSTNTAIAIALFLFLVLDIRAGRKAIDLPQPALRHRLLYFSLLPLALRELVPPIPEIEARITFQQATTLQVRPHPETHNHTSPWEDKVMAQSSHCQILGLNKDTTERGVLIMVFLVPHLTPARQG